jgi:alanine racemase
VIAAGTVREDQASWPQHRVGSPLKWAHVDAARLTANTRALVDHAGSAQVMAMIKANGYGHGAVLTARAAIAGGARWLGVSSPDEAGQLRSAGIDEPILIVGWSPPDALDELITAGVTFTVCTPADVERAAAAAGLGRTAQVHVKIDSGMNRYGAKPETVAELARALRDHAGRVRVTGIFTHFADADGGDAVLDWQHETFMNALKPIRDISPQAVVHCCNSAATLRFPEYHHDLVRPGIAIYGFAPAHCDGIIELAPAMTFCAQVVHVKTVQSGERVGYNLTWTAPRRSRIATVAAGYADGVRRDLSNRGSVTIGGRLCPIVGRVSMDQTTVDITDCEGVGVGDAAVFFGTSPGNTAADVASEIGTISYEVLCAVSARVPRTVAGDA